jgi:hypothetical protein
MSMLSSSSLEGLACQRHINRRLLAGTDAEARGETDRAMRVYAELFLARKRPLELVADPTRGAAVAPASEASPAVARPSADLPSRPGPTRVPSGHVAGPTLAGL